MLVVNNFIYDTANKKYKINNKKIIKIIVYNIYRIKEI